MRYLIKPVAYAIWALAFGISLALAWEFHDGQNKIAISLAILALVLSGFGLLFARDAWQKYAYPECAAGIALWAVGASFFAITEWGYWDSSYGQRHAEFQQGNKAQVRREGLKDQRWKALTTGEFPPTPAQIEAQVSAAKMNDRWASTRQCTEATTTPSKDFCKGYFELLEKLAAAQQRDTAEKQFIQSTTDQAPKLVHNLLAGAEVIARRFDIEERLAADIVIFAAWVLLFLARDLGALVADPGGARRRPQEARGDPNAAPAPDTGLIVVPPAPAPALRVEAPVPALPDVSAWREDLKRKPHDAVIPPSEEVGQPETPEPVHPAPAIGPHLAYSADDAPRRPTKGEKRAAQKKTMAAPDEDAERKTVELWAAECLSARPDRKSPPSSGDCHASLLAYCERERVSLVDQVRMTQIMTEILKPQKVKGRYPRNAKERIWPGWNLTMPAAGRLRASA